jgi:hypothetical protein
MEIKEQISKMYDSGVREINVTYDDGFKKKIRIFKASTGAICQYKKGSSRRGYEIHPAGIVSVSAVTSKKSEEQKWIDGWKKVDAKLEKSGLWNDIRAEIKLAFEIGYPKLKQMSNIYWQISNSDGKEIAFFKEHCPLLVKTNPDETEYVNTTVLWHYDKLPKVKKMMFAKKFYNESILKRIQEAMDSKTAIHEDHRYNYDVSLEYNPQKNKMWYSEEYKNCGNGHYYIALDSTHALFMEDD